jgi:hypothetical protein
VNRDSVFEDVGRLGESGREVPPQALDQGLRLLPRCQRKVSETMNVPLRDDKQMSGGQGRDRRENDKVTRLVTDATRPFPVHLLEFYWKQPA